MLVFALAVTGWALSVALFLVRGSVARLDAPAS
jgi:hypothetical protein